MECRICGSHHLVQLHHILHGIGKRKQLERPENVVYLCWEHHHGNYGVHGKYGHELDIKLKLMLQDFYFNQGYNEDLVRELMGGKLYD